MTWSTASQKAASWPAWMGIHWSAYLEVMLKSGESTTSLAPSCRASAAKWTSGVRVIPRFAPIETMNLE